MGKQLSKGRLPRKSNKVRGVNFQEVDLEYLKGLKISFDEFVQYFIQKQKLENRIVTKVVKTGEGVKKLTMTSTGNDNIFTSCRKGDLSRIQYLVEKKEIDLNVRDCWDSTPLYYACHCGHTEVVQYLLEHGAKCEANTFDGERCLYGALTNEIKRLLLDSKVAGINTAKWDEFDEFCEKMLAAEEFSDFQIRLRDGKTFKLHRCILGPRSPGLNSLLLGKWKDQQDVKNNLIDPRIFEEFIKFLYTGKLKCTIDQYEDMKQLAKRCQMNTMISLLDHCLTTSIQFQRSKSSKAIKVTTLVLDTEFTRQLLEEDFCDILDAGMDEEYARGPFLGFRYGLADNCDKEDINPYHDVCLKVEGARFYCNKVFLCTRSNYFRALLDNPFGEQRETCNGIPVIILRDVTPNVISAVLYYIYTNMPYTMDEDNVFDILETSDIYLLPGLKRLCGNYLCNKVCHSNVIELLHISRVRELVRLEDRCTEYLADYIAEFINDENFREFIKHDALEVQCRQETDSIPIIDDIRYHITGQVASFAALEESQEKLRLIDNLLEELDLEA